MAVPLPIRTPETGGSIMVKRVRAIESTIPLKGSRTMKAGILHGPGDIRVEEVDRPELGDDGIVIKVRAAGICGSDLHPYRVASQAPSHDRKAHGHEVAGDVVETGPNVRDVKVGDRVWAWPFLPCFKCAFCEQKNYWACTNRKGMAGNGMHGGFAEYVGVPAVVVPQEDTRIVPNVIKLPDSMSYQEGVLVEPISVGSGVAKYAEPKAEDIVFILGAGIIGLGTVINFRASGVSKIIISDVSEKRLAAARELGADIVINAAKEDVAKRVMGETSGAGADIVVEVAGQPATFRQSIELSRRHGKVMLVGIYEEMVSFSPNVLVLKALKTIGCIDAHFAEGFEIMSAGWVKDSQVVSHTFPLDRIRDAFEAALNTQESIKVMIEP